MKTSPDEIDLSRIIYRPSTHNRPVAEREKLTVYGIDTEADRSGKCFMICTSEGDTFRPYEFPQCLFNRKYRHSVFVAYNLKYDAGAFLQNLPLENLQELRETRKTTYDNFKYRVYANKELTISNGKHNIKIYDIYGFYNTSLQRAAETYLKDSKLDGEVEKYDAEYIAKNWSKIAKYCIHDSRLTARLANILLDVFDGFGVRPRKLISTAYVSWQYFRSHTEVQTVNKIFYNYPGVMRYAIAAYNGGKFEVTQRGPGEFTEYDIVSAYPFEITKLLPINDARILSGDVGPDVPAYRFIHCDLNIPFDTPSPIVRKHYNTCTFPNGVFSRVITGIEYDYARKRGWVRKILNAVSIVPVRHKPVFAEEIAKLMEYKDLYKNTGDPMRYQAVKIFLNSLYGKFAQLIPEGEYLMAGSSWNPVYASYITAATRIRITEMQETYRSIIAVHTDSIISTEPLPIHTGKNLGEWEKSSEGTGVMFLTGIYQIGTKSKFRGFPTKIPLLDMLPTDGNFWKVSNIAPYTWREVIFRTMDLEEINHFTERWKEVSIKGDVKRNWLDDYEDFSEVRTRNVISTPLNASNVRGW